MFKWLGMIFKGKKDIESPINNTSKNSNIDLCNTYRNNGASNGGCMGFSANWSDTHEMCIKCPKYFENM